MHEPFPLSGRLSGFEADTMPWLIGIFSRRALCASPLPAGARSVAIVQALLHFDALSHLTFRRHHPTFLEC